MTSLTSHYLPPDLRYRVETQILAKCPPLVGRLIDAEEIDIDEQLQRAAVPVDQCIRNLTHRFPDGPTYFQFVRAQAPTAMVQVFRDFQCLVFSEATYRQVTTALGALFEWTPLEAFVRFGVEPEDGNEASLCSRREAVQALLETAEPPSLGAQVWAVTIGNLILHFLAGHELGHFALGHVRAGESGQSYLTEVDQARPDDRVASRAMEWEADAFGAAATIWMTGSQRMDTEHPWSTLFPDNQSALRAFVIGAYILSSIMDLTDTTERPSDERTHPAPMARVTLMTSALATTINQWGAIDGDTAIAEARASIRAVEIALNMTGGGMMGADEATALEAELRRSAPTLEAALPAVKSGQDRSRLQGYFWARIFD